MKDTWFQRRNRGIFLTIRDVDCKNFDAERLARDLDDLHVTYVQFFASGYVTTHPTALEHLRKSPSLGQRDLVGEIIEALHSYGIKAIPAIELGVIPEKAGASHPDWCACDADGQLQRVGEGLYATCALSAYVREYSAEIIRELLERYEVDGLYFMGFGWHEGICYCERCREDFQGKDFQDGHGESIPTEKDWANPIYRKYIRWRMSKTTELSRTVVAHVKEIDPELPVLTGGVYFGDPDWTMRSSLDIESYSAFQDGVFSEAQSRMKISRSATNRIVWQPFIWSGEGARYLDAVSGNKPVWITASYFLAWPWRRSAVPEPAQRVFLAQIAANGASIKVNLSGGPPAVHNDRRGFKAVKETFEFLEKNEFYFESDRSAARVALVYSQDTLIFYGQDDPEGRYLDSFRGMELALLEAHIPFDIISTRSLFEEDILKKYNVLLLPCLACMSNDEADAVRRFVHGGGGVVASFETSLYDSDGYKRENFLLDDIMMASYGGETRDVMADENDMPEVRQCYVELADPDHSIMSGIDDTDVIPIMGDFCVVEPDHKRGDTPLEKGDSFRVFPEGFAYLPANQTKHALAVVSKAPHKQRAVYFPFQIGKMFWHIELEDLSNLIVNAVKWAGYDSELEVEGPTTLHVSLREKENHIMVHLINLTGGRRFFRQLVPLHDINLTLKQKGIEEALLLSSGEKLPATVTGDGLRVTVKMLNDYDVVVFRRR